MKGTRLFLPFFLTIFFFGILWDSRKLAGIIRVRAAHVDEASKDMSQVRVYTNAKNTIVACMLPDACISNYLVNHVVHLPKYMRLHDKLVRSCLRLNVKVEYYELSESEPDKKQIDVNVLGLPYIDKAFKHFAHFGPKVIAFSLLPASLFLSSNRSIVPNCVRSDGKLKRCNNEIKWPSNPRLVVENRVLHNRKGTWNRDFMNFLTTNSTNLHIVNFGDLRNNFPATCFRSAIMSPLKYDGTNELHDRLLREKGVQRQLNIKKGNKCEPRVVVLFRDTNRRLDRTFLKSTIEKFPETVHEYLKRVNISATLEIVTDLGRDRGFEQQRQVFEGADLLVSVHGAELSNALFLRNRARLVEISPFGLFDAWFQSTSFAAGAQRQKICAPPDRDQFMQCVKDRMVSRGEDRHDVAKSKAVKEFDLLAKRYRWLERRSKCRVREQDGRKCVRKQRILVDQKQLSELIAREVRSFCNG